MLKCADAPFCLTVSCLKTKILVYSELQCYLFFHGSKTSPVTLREDRRYRVFEEKLHLSHSGKIRVTGCLRENFICYIQGRSEIESVWRKTSPLTFREDKSYRVFEEKLNLLYSGKIRDRECLRKSFACHIQGSSDIQGVWGKTSPLTFSLNSSKYWTETMDLTYTHVKRA
jgi:NADH:ubiquinone oxidoreductase subunit E